MDIYTEGEKSGKKKDSVSIAQLMKTATTEKGDKLFRPSEYLRKEQISSYFSRLTYQRRKRNAHLEDNVESGSHDDDDNDSMEEDDSELDEEEEDEKRMKVTTVRRRVRMKMTVILMRICFVPLKKIEGIWKHRTTLKR